LSKFTNSPLRVALFTDSFHEANGVATLSRQLTEFAQARELPFLAAYGGGQTRVTQVGSLATVELKRGPAAFPLDKNLYCDPLLSRHKQFVIHQLLAFKPDLIHITGPGDLGFLGLLVAHILHIPLVASWHTNLHEYLARRLNRILAAAPRKLRERASLTVERESLRGLLRFYRTARFVLAPNQSMVDLLHARTGKPAFLMRHGVDLAKYSAPSPGSHTGRPFCIGYVGRLTTEKNVRFFMELERTLLAAGQQNFTFLIVGEGGQQKWMQRHLRNAEFAGVLRGADLAAAYGRMDAFVFPSLTDTFGLVILEAMASGIPVIVAPETGQRVGIEDGVSGFLSQDFGISLLRLMRNHSQLTCMSGAARKFACEHSWQSVFEQLYRTYADGLSADARMRLLRETA
jgi:phosphatidylinositol alpha 1,6-mannosyltransferase